jgi:hypothetical protein
MTLCHISGTQGTPWFAIDIQGQTYLYTDTPQPQLALERAVRASK